MYMIHLYILSACTHKQTHTVTVTDMLLVVKTGTTPNRLFDGQLNCISRNNGALNLFHVPWRVPERGSGVRGREISPNIRGEAGALA